MREMVTVLERAESVKLVDLAGYSLDELHALLDLEKRYNQTLPGREEITVFFERLSDGELRSYVRSLQERLDRETEVLHRFASLGLNPFVHDLLDLPLPVRVVTNAGGTGTIDDGAVATYRDGTIFLAGEAPGLVERLILFAGRGIIGNDLFHEVIHAMQGDGDLYHSAEEVLESLIGSLPDQPRLALAEAHAWTACLPGFRHELLIDVIGSCYSLTRPELLQSAFDLLYRLWILGVGDRDLAKLVGSARWCDIAATYLELETELERRLHVVGASRQDLELEVERRKVIERLQAVRAVGIARELMMPSLEVAQVGFTPTLPSTR